MTYRTRVLLHSFSTLNTAETKTFTLSEQFYNRVISLSAYATYGGTSTERYLGVIASVAGTDTPDYIYYMELNPPPGTKYILPVSQEIAPFGAVLTPGSVVKYLCYNAGDAVNTLDGIICLVVEEIGNELPVYGPGYAPEKAAPIETSGWRLSDVLKGVV
jgi:hypothetical protein